MLPVSPSAEQQTSHPEIESVTCSPALSVAVSGYTAPQYNQSSWSSFLPAFHSAVIPPFFDYPPEIRKVIYTTNAIESVNMSLRKITKNRGSFPSDEALLKLFYLAINNISKKWTMPIRDWKAALNRFNIQFEDRMPQR